MRRPFLLLAGLVAACSVPPPAPPLPPPAPSAPPPSASAPPPPPPRVALRWSVDEDFVAGVQLDPRPLDAERLAAALPRAHRADFVRLGARERFTDDEGKQAAALARTLEASGAGGRQGEAAAALRLAAGWLAEIGHLPAKKEPWSVRVRRLYDEAAQRADATTLAGALARYRLALLRERLGQDDRGESALAALVAVDGELRAEAAVRLARLRGQGPKGSPALAAAALVSGLQSQVPTTRAVRGALIHGLMLAHFRQEQYGPALVEATDFLRGFRGVGAPSVASEGALRVASDCMEHLDVTGPLDQAASPERDEALLRLSWRAVRRGDTALAEQVAGDVLAGTPLSAQAPNALRILIAAAEVAGTSTVADERRARLGREYGPTSVWAESQRAARQPDGWPSEAVIAAASKPPTPARPETSPQPAAAALVRLCLEPHAWRRGETVVVRLSATVTPGGESPAAVQASLAQPSAAFEPVVSCLRKLGPSHLRHAPASFDAEATWDP